ncbi:acyl-ACP--UDP-N-acetylglucosamine O-acyltransferase [Xanthomonas perforans]|nr:acyl-ACP--UDP-N-acetylglucosamine O-acyltransferase [Xanthomonas perforans]
MRDSTPLIHPTAVIDPSATLADDVRVGAFSLIGADVQIGGEPQDKKYAGERTELVIGDGNVIREFVTINRGTGGGGGVTVVGNDNWMLAYTHVAHDCHVGNHCVFSNNTTLAGHVTVGDYVIISGFAGAHQFCRIGAHAFLGMGALTNGDVPPFTMVGSDSLGRPRGINSEGLKRRGFDAERITAIKRAYRTLYVAGLPLADAKLQLAEQAKSSEDVRGMLEFIEAAERPLLR